MEKIKLGGCTRVNNSDIYFFFFLNEADQDTFSVRVRSQIKLQYSE